MPGAEPGQGAPLHRTGLPLDLLQDQSPIRELAVPAAPDLRGVDLNQRSAMALAQVRAEWQWGPGASPGSVAPLYDTSGHLIAYDVDFTLDGSTFGSYETVAAEWDFFVEARSVEIDGRLENGTSRRSAPLDWGSPRYGSVTVSATLDAPPIRGTRRGVSNFYANGWRAAAVAAHVLGVVEPQPSRIILTGSWERLYEFSAGARRIYVQGHEPFGWYEGDEYDRATDRAVSARLASLEASLQSKGSSLSAQRESERAFNRALLDDWMAGRMPPRSWRCISGYNTSFVPYRWYAGCSPTAGSMVLNYYDEVSSYGRITYDYSRKVCPVQEQHRCHVSDAQVWMPIAMDTDANGDTWSYNIYPGLLNYANNGCGYSFHDGIELVGSYGSWGFDEGRDMIDGNHPFVWSMLYYPGSGGAAHSAACVGYDTAPEPDEFVCFNTWATGGTAESVPCTGEVSDITWLHGPLPGGGTTQKVELTSLDGYQNYGHCGSTGFFTSGSQTNITWSNSGPAADHVEIHFSSDGGNSWYYVAQSTPDDGLHVWTVPNLAQASDSCRVRIYQVSGSGGLLSADGSYGDFTIELGAYLPPPAPDYPPDGATGVPTEGDLEWSAVPGAIGYRIQMGTECGIGTEFDLPGTDTAAHYAGLEEGETYYWRIRSLNGSGIYGPYSDCSSFTTEGGGGTFIRGDDDASGVVDISDPIRSLAYQFAGGPPPSCLDAADIDDSGQVDISDPIYSLSYQFAGGPAPPSPFPTCGTDPTNDALDCTSFAPCGTNAPAPPVGEKGGEIALRLAQDGRMVQAAVIISTDRELRGFEGLVRFDPEALEFAGLEPATGEGRSLEDGGFPAMDFLSAHAEGGLVRFGAVPDFSMERLWPAGKNQAAVLRFRLLQPAGLHGGVIEVVGGRFVAEDQGTLIPARGTAGTAAVDGRGAEATGEVRLRLPNPYRPNAPIVLESGRTQPVDLAVFDVQGRLVRTLYSGQAGTSPILMSWDGRSDGGEDLSSGLYYMRAIFPEREISRKLLLLR